MMDVVLHGQIAILPPSDAIGRSSKITIDKVVHCYHSFFLQSSSISSVRSFVIKFMFCHANAQRSKPLNFGEIHNLFTGNPPLSSPSVSKWLDDDKHHGYRQLQNTAEKNIKKNEAIETFHLVDKRDCKR